MMQPSTRIARIRVEVAPGPTRSKRWVSFMAYGRPHRVVVDARDVCGNALWVAVIDEHPERTKIEIPLSITASYRIDMPKSSVALAEPPIDRSGLAGLGHILLSLVRSALE